MGFLADAIAGLETALGSITGLTIMAHPPGAQAKYPSAEIDLGGGEYGATVVDDYEATLTLRIRVEAAKDTAGWAALELYLDPTGTKSIKAAVEADPTLGSTVDWAKVEEHTAPERDGNNPALFTSVVTMRIYKASA